MPTVLVTLAHPDDECVVAAGTIAHHARLGNKVKLYIATKGEGGIEGYLRAGHDWISPGKLAHIRHQEMRKVYQILGVDELIQRDYMDGGLGFDFGISSTEEKNMVLLERDILQVMEEVRPDIVITFPPSGLTHHTDHQMISLVTRRAAQQYSGKTRLFYRIITDHQGIVNVVHDDFHPRYHVPVERYWNQIYETMYAHQSQFLVMDHIFLALRKDGGMQKLWTHEHFAEVTL
jgi:LmbE family N-acetylglucosaminyl deacetylase